MSFPILGLHHVTATVDDAQADLDFAKSALGLRLVKKTVNFDNHSVYHFYYGDERGTPGTIWTTFPYKGKGVPVGVQGAGQVTTTSFSVPTGSLEFWKERLARRGFKMRDSDTRFGESSVSVLDPSGLVIDLVEAGDDKRAPWIPSNEGINSSNAIRGLHSVTMTVRTANTSIAFMQEWLGYSVVDKKGSRTRVGVNGGGAGKVIDIVESSDAPAAKNGLGTVHHVAMAIENPDDQMRLRTELTKSGVQVTPLMDRQYFQSIYFREPGGILYEVATMKPGFAVDEPLSDLGRALKLPPAAEVRRGEIEQQLAKVEY
jgi:glyoxalase family protein